MFVIFVDLVYFCAISSILINDLIMSHLSDLLLLVSRIVSFIVLRAEASFVNKFIFLISS